MTAAPGCRLALDQNFPVPLLDANRDYLPSEFELVHVHRIDPRLPRLSDRHLLIALRQLGWDGLVTMNYKMLTVPDEIAAIVSTKSTVVAVVGLGDDPIRGTGALLYNLPGMHTKINPKAPNVFRINHKPTQPSNGWDHLSLAAKHRGLEPRELYDHHKVDPDEMETTILT